MGTIEAVLTEKKSGAAILTAGNRVGPYSQRETGARPYSHSQQNFAPVLTAVRDSCRRWSLLPDTKVWFSLHRELADEGHDEGHGLIGVAG